MVGDKHVRGGLEGGVWCLLRGEHHVKWGRRGEGGEGDVLQVTVL